MQFIFIYRYNMYVLGGGQGMRTSDNKFIYISNIHIINNIFTDMTDVQCALTIFFHTSQNRILICRFGHFNHFANVEYVQFDWLNLIDFVFGKILLSK